MGSWGEKAFENDSALDWLTEFEDRGVVALHSILSTVVQTSEDEYLDVDDGAAAIAAAEIVSAALGHGRDRVPKRLHEWLDANSDAIVVEDLVTARRAVERVLAVNSELRGLWHDGGSNTAWHAEMRVLLTRLGGNPAAAAPRTEATERTTEHFEQAAKTLLFAFLRKRGFEPNKQQMKRIHATRDVEEIHSWLARLADAPSVEAVLDAGAAPERE
ncbi:DUF4259 domain-containing protein [Pendulispora rubella]|uniref:DUF4259 domain-containing protein n=1 Tax=Pendulispora rubella TaxID=2741070 RepID=A0ABZ2KSY5_9BACT